MSFLCEGTGATDTNQIWLYADPINYNSAYTYLFKVYNRGGATTGSHLFKIYNGSEFDAIEVQPSADEGLRINAAKTGSSDQQDTATNIFVEDTWHDLAVVRASSTSLKLYLNGSVVATSTFDVGTRASTGGSPSDGLYFTPNWNTAIVDELLVADIKGWQSALTEAEMTDEFAASTPLKASCLHYIPCRYYSPRNANGKPLELIGGNNHIGTAHTGHSPEEPDVPYWRSVARSVGINTKGPG